MKTVLHEVSAYLNLMNSKLLKEAQNLASFQKREVHQWNVKWYIRIGYTIKIGWNKKCDGLWFFLLSRGIIHKVLYKLCLSIVYIIVMDMIIADYVAFLIKLPKHDEYYANIFFYYFMFYKKN